MSDPKEPYETAERRPITTRDTNWARRLAHALAQWGITANLISVAGMVAGLLSGVALCATTWSPDHSRFWWIAGAILIQLRLMANMLDGMVAVETKTASPVGELYNEIPDRVSDSATLIGLGYAAGGGVVLGYGAALMAIFVAYVRAMGKVAGAHQEFCGPLAKPQRMFIATVTALYCGLAPVTWPLHPQGEALPALGYWVLVLMIGGCVVTAVRRLWKIAGALRQGTPT